MKIRNRLGYAAAYCLIILLTGCGGNHAVDSSKASTAENQMVANTPKYGTFVPNLEIVREFTQKPSWGEDVMVQSITLWYAGPVLSRGLSGNSYPCCGHEREVAAFLSEERSGAGRISMVLTVSETWRQPLGVWNPETGSFFHGRYFKIRDSL